MARAANFFETEVIEEMHVIGPLRLYLEIEAKADGLLESAQRGAVLDYP